MVKYDRWKRYILPHPETGKEQSWTRVTTLKSTLSDTYNLDLWKLRMVVLGMSRRPDLVNMAGALTTGKEHRDELNAIARKAQDASGGGIAANEGTALHNWFDLVDKGKSTAHASRTVQVGIDAYRSLLLRKDIEILSEFSERVICIPELNVCGRLDRIGYVGEYLRILDIKSQQDMEYNQHELAIQLACYAYAPYVWDEKREEWEQLPENLDKKLATVLWTPSGTDHADAFNVDIELGWAYAKISADVRKVRARKDILTDTPDSPGWHLQAIQAATDPEEIRSIGRMLMRQKQFTDEIKVAGIQRIKELTGGK